MVKAILYNIEGLNLSDNTLYLNRDYYLHYYINDSIPMAIVYENDGWSTLGTVKYPDSYFENYIHRRKRIIASLLNEKM